MAKNSYKKTSNHMKTNQIIVLIGSLLLIAPMLKILDVYGSTIACFVYLSLLLILKTIFKTYQN